MANIVRPRSWGKVSPPPGSQIDWGHPLAQGLVIAALPVDGVVVDLVRGHARRNVTGTATITSQGTRVNGTAGTDFVTHALTDGGACLARPTGSTIVFSEVPIAHGGASTRAVGNGSSDVRVAGLCVRHEDPLGGGGGGNYNFGPIRGTSGASFTRYRGSTVLTAGRRYQCAVTYADNAVATAPLMWVNGVPETMTLMNAGAGTVNVAGGDLTFHNRADGAENFAGIIDYAWFWARPLTPSEIAWVRAEPYAFVQPPGPRVLYTLLASPPPIVADGCMVGLENGDGILLESGNALGVQACVLDLTPATITVTPVALAVSATVTRNLTPVTITVTPVALTRTAAASRTLAPASITVTPVALARTAAVTRTISPASIAVTPVALSRTIGAVTRNLSPASITLTPVALTRTATVSRSLTAASVTVTAVALARTAGAVTRNLSPASITVTPVALARTAATTRNLTPTSIAVTPVALSVSATVSRTLGTATITLTAVGLARTATITRALSPAVVQLLAVALEVILTGDPGCLHVTIDDQGEVSVALSDPHVVDVELADSHAVGLVLSTLGESTVLPCDD